MVQPSDQHIITIVSLDLFGYSRLTEQDEFGTHRALMACMRERLEPLVDDHRGVIVKSTGDGALVRFPSARAAVESMRRFQLEMAASEARFPPSRRLIFRVGIHLAPTIRENGDVFGHGVNLAVRLQERADPGSIFLSDAVARCLDHDMKRLLERIGRRALKNIEEKVEVYRWRADRGGPTRLERRAGGLLAAIVSAGLVLPTSALDNVDLDNATVGDIVDAAVLNGGGPADHARSEPRPASLSYELDRPVDEIAALLPLATDEDGWIEPHHGLVSGPLTTGINTTMAAAERSLENRGEIAEDAYLQALALYGRYTPEAFAKAIDELERALRLKPGYNAAHALLAAVYWGGLQNRWQLGRGQTRAGMLKLALSHMRLAPEPDPFLNMVRSEMLTARGRHDQAINEASTAVRLQPSLAVGHYARGRALLYAGRAVEAKAPIRTAIRLNPHASRYLFGLALAQFSADRFDDAERTLARATAQNSGDDWFHLLMAATQGHRGMRKEARQAIGRFDRLSLERRGWFASQIPYVHRWPFRYQEDQDRLHLGMVLAGIPEIDR